MKQSQKLKKRVFLTGATGNWGQYILREFARRADRFDVLALVLPTPRDTPLSASSRTWKISASSLAMSRTTPTVLSYVTETDFVLHTGAVVSPFADDHPELTHAVNVGGARNIIRAIKSQPEPDAIRLVTIGTRSRK
ncbi:NAD-dependent epimerase/dehydratase family protein [Arthrobacter sp. StoSoilB5]|uniref:NAD-dependent epimerase/dehydratase family protein n=1 Tax=Arthrobacter sp. StoSoilB5 TaxID=2830992 RepID=UPI001CC7F44E|nr:NAD-dependent epimerase/dehydratase family protein [Arthrobacter sp. StoSoilB5]BCW45077.1 hypothetical protein StoSoilB5_22610 [Arthrobacter sp. StoSoilB5]